MSLRTLRQPSTNGANPLTLTAMTTRFTSPPMLKIITKTGQSGHSFRLRHRPGGSLLKEGGRAISRGSGCLPLSYFCLRLFVFFFFFLLLLLLLAASRNTLYIATIVFDSTITHPLCFLLMILVFFPFSLCLARVRMLEYFLGILLLASCSLCFRQSIYPS